MRLIDVIDLIAMNSTYAYRKGNYWGYLGIVLAIVLVFVTLPWLMPEYLAMHIRIWFQHDRYAKMRQTKVDGPTTF